jgi:hypothetical protein
VNCKNIPFNAGGQWIFFYSGFARPMKINISQLKLCLKIPYFCNTKKMRGISQLISSLSSKNGPVAEWLGRALQKLVQRFESARDLHQKAGF